jgi:hypothetical protein
LVEKKGNQRADQLEKQTVESLADSLEFQSAGRKEMHLAEWSDKM